MNTLPEHIEHIDERNTEDKYMQRSLSKLQRDSLAITESYQFDQSSLISTAKNLSTESKLRGWRPSPFLITHSGTTLLLEKMHLEQSINTALVPTRHGAIFFERWIDIPYNQNLKGRLVNPKPSQKISNSHTISTLLWGTNRQEIWINFGVLQAIGNEKLTLLPETLDIRANLVIKNTDVPQLIGRAEESLSRKERRVRKSLLRTTQMAWKIINFEVLGTDEEYPLFHYIRRH